MTAILESDSIRLEEESFQDFFRSFERDDLGSKYRRRLAQVATTQGRSLVIDFDDLVTFDPALARRVVERPDEYLDLAGRAATAQLRVADPEYAQRIVRIHARFRRLPEKSPLRQVGAEHLKKLILVDGIVVRSTQVRPAVVRAAYRCLKCAQMVREEEAGELVRGLGGTCPHCKQRTVFELVQSESEFRNTQDVRVQERPEDLPPGQLPRYLDVRLEDDIVDTARPGDRVALTALVRAERPSETGEPRGRAFNLYLEANYVDVAGKEAEVVEITAEDEKKILEAAKDPWIHRNLVRSLAPSIHGYEDVKEAVLYVLFGGVQKQLPDGIKIRGEINTILIGDPGTAKSQLLQYVAKIAPRGLYTSGRGSTAAGLTAAVLREKTGGMVLEAGALVLADKGIACLHPDSRVLFEGAPTRIADLFDANRAKVARTKRGHLLRVSQLGGNTVNLRLKNLRTRETTCSVVTERDYEGPLLRVSMKSGFEPRVTPDHLLLDGAEFRWRPAGEFRKGDRLLTVQRLPERHEKISVMDILPDDWIVQPSPEERAEIRRRILQRFRSIAAANRHYGLRREALARRDAIPLAIFRRLLSELGLSEEWRDRAFAYGRRKRTERLRVANFTPELAYVLGFMYGDGHAQSDSKHSIVSISQSDGHRRYIDRLLSASQATFVMSWGDVERPGSSERAFRVHHLHQGSNLVFGLYDWVTRDALRNIHRLDQDALAGFLAGAMDADGCISTKRYRKGGKEYRHVEVVFSLSDDANENRSLLLALRRFDVYSRIRQQKGVKLVQITGRDDATRLLRALAPYSAKCREIPTRLRAVSTDNEEVPAPLLARVLRNVRPVPQELLRNGTWSTFQELRAETRRPFKSSVRRLGWALASWLSPEQAASLDALASADYAMDEVVGIETESYKGPVYDLRVPEGASFLADGLCVHNCIDEIDKMREDDRVAIHEALEQQTVSVAKGGIVATLNARAAVLAAGNPEYGRYVPERNVTENINLPVTILSRFDLIFILRDTPEPETDSRMSEHILALHKTQSHSEVAAFPPDFLRKYVGYARKIIPVLTPEAVKEIQDFYLRMRAKSGTEGAIAITPRQLEALIRIAEARARCFLRNQVTVEDARGSIRIMGVSLQDAGMDVKTGAMDIDVIMTGKPRSQRDTLQRIIDVLQELEKDTVNVEETVLVNVVAEREKIDEREARRFVGLLIRDGMLYAPKPGILKRTRG